MVLFKYKKLPIKTLLSLTVLLFTLTGFPVSTLCSPFSIKHPGWYFSKANRLDNSDA
jgi:hypothetical protein